MKISFSFFYLLLPCWECRCKSNHIFLPSLSFSKNRKPKKNYHDFQKAIGESISRGASHWRGITTDSSGFRSCVYSWNQRSSFFQLVSKVWCHSLFFVFLFFSVSPCCTRERSNFLVKVISLRFNSLVLLDGPFVCLLLPRRYFVFMGMSRA